jgi:hypothetical protein
MLPAWQWERRYYAFAGKKHGMVVLSSSVFLSDRQNLKAFKI